tara:strand:- start:2537 stop:3217 length:681 start_codon:yes stop_codon:yes gene_type:complete
MIAKEVIKEVSNNLNEILILRNKKTQKQDGSFVTEGDIKCQNIILDVVNNKFGDLNLEVVSEEINSEDFFYDPTKNYIVVDPIDGTENFCSGLKEWGISLSTYLEDKHYESAIFLPELDEYLETGNFLNHFQSRIVGLSSNLSRIEIDHQDQNEEYRIMGCCVYNMLNVIRGSYKSFSNLNGAYSWDVLAGLNLALEHGLKVIVDGKNYEGQFLYPNKRYSFSIRR